MAYAANTLVSEAVAKARLNILGTDAAVLANLQAAVEVASTWLERHCERVLISTAYVTKRLRGPRGPRLWPGPAPISVADTVTITVDEAAQTVWRVEADGDPAGFDIRVMSSDSLHPVGLNDHFYRPQGWGGGHARINPYNVVATFTAGYALAAVPADLAGACVDIAAKLYRDYSKQLQEVVTLQMPSGAVTILDTDIPKRARLIADYYKRRSV